MSADNIISVVKSHTVEISQFQARGKIIFKRNIQTHKMLLYTHNAKCSHGVKQIIHDVGTEMPQM